jgi:hypothetical protein
MQVGTVVGQMWNFVGVVRLGCAEDVYFRTAMQLVVRNDSIALALCVGIGTRSGMFFAFLLFCFFLGDQSRMKVNHCGEMREGGTKVFDRFDRLGRRVTRIERSVDDLRKILVKEKGCRKEKTGAIVNELMRSLREGRKEGRRSAVQTYIEQMLRLRKPEQKPRIKKEAQSSADPCHLISI